MLKFISFMGKRGMHTGLWWESPKERDHWEDIHIGRGDNIKMNPREIGRGDNIKMDPREIPVIGREGP
jgi:hypothetical protein